MRQINVHNYYVYMVANEWRNALYIGVTNSLETRIWQHKNGTFRGFTKKYNCRLLVYFEIYENIEQAIAREKQIKGWTRAKKDALVEKLNPKWNDLAAEWYYEPAALAQQCRIDETSDDESRAAVPSTGDPSPSSAAAPARPHAAAAAQDDSLMNRRNDDRRP